MQFEQYAKPKQYGYVFLICALIAASFFVPYMIIDGGLFTFYGDFNVQQIPFYKLAHQAVRSGDIFWSWTTDLGANFLGSYSFYLLGSPFFWLTLPFPNEFVPYLMGPLLILKFACAGVTSFAFFKRFVKDSRYAVIGALLYAFSGFSVYNVFFNHFHEAIVFFPLLLIGLEELMQNGRRGVFALAAGINLLVNYYFFFGEIIFLLIYWILRCVSGAWDLTLRRFFQLVLESLLGVGLACFLFFPAALTALGNPRTGDFVLGWDMLLYSNPQRYGSILQSFLFPPDLAARPNFFPSLSEKWCSLSAWLPVFSITGVLGFLQLKQKSFIKKLLFILFLMAMVPVLNQLFSALNSLYYARWFYMFTLILCLATVKALESTEVNWQRSIRITSAVTIAIALAIGFLPYKKGDEVLFGLMQYPERYWPWVIVAAVSLILCYVLTVKIKPQSRRFLPVGVMLIAVVSAVYGNIFIATGKAIGTNGQWLKQVCVDGADTLQLEDMRNCRTDFYREGDNQALDNQSMFWDIPCIQAFHSLVPASVMEFYPEIGVSRSVGSRPDFELQALRSFLSVRYYFDNNRRTELPYEGWTYLGDQLTYSVWENQNYIPFGFTYDTYIDKQTWENVSKEQRDNLLLKAIYLNDEQIEKYGHLFQKYEGTLFPYYDYDQLVADCDARRSNSCYSFERDNTGFTAKINSPNQTLVFFSVPWESGWSATVNGQPVEVEKVNVGFMAVEVPAGESEIRFDYMTPGLIPGLTVSGASLFVLLVYLLIGHIVSRRSLALSRLSHNFANDDRFYSTLPQKGERNLGMDLDDTYNDFFAEPEKEPPQEE